MKKYRLDDMINGWFIGNFEPTAYKTSDMEIGIKSYAKGEYEIAHFHKIATEFTVVIKGIVKMNDIVYKKGDIVQIEPGIETNFMALSEVVTVVVKIPGALNDKYIN